MNHLICKQYNVGEMNYAELCENIRCDFNQFAFKKRSRFRLVSEYVEWLRQGSKCTTVRYRPNAIDIPSDLKLPLVRSLNDDVPDDGVTASYDEVGLVKITQLVIKPFFMLNDTDAHRDGFIKLQDLKDALRKLYYPIYGLIQEHQYVTIYTIKIFQENMDEITHMLTHKH